MHSQAQFCLSNGPALICCICMCDDMVSCNIVMTVKMSQISNIAHTDGSSVQSQANDEISTYFTVCLICDAWALHYTSSLHPFKQFAVHEILTGLSST